MPDHSGLELASIITATTEEPWPVMLLLSSAQSVDRVLLEAAGISRSLTKPVRRSALFNELVEILADVHGVEALTRAAPEERVDLLGQRVLVVEDNEINQLVPSGSSRPSATASRSRLTARRPWRWRRELRMTPS